MSVPATAGGRAGGAPVGPRTEGGPARGRPPSEAAVAQWAPSAARPGATLTEPDPVRRPYDSTLRRQRAAETRERIVGAACDLLRGSAVRDWRGLTVRAVAERAGVNERTVYRHFANERALRDEVMRRLEQEAGIELDGLGLGDIADVTARILATVSSFPIEPRPPLDPTLTETGQRQREALRRAVAASADSWPAAEREVAAAMFDVLWAVAAYERLVVDWQLDSGDAIAGLTWVAGLIEEAVRTGHRPGGRPVVGPSTVVPVGD